jgi:nucleoside-diphosphate-sugar epimerase
MKIFVTGGSGFVGGHLLWRLRAHAHELIASSRSAAAAEAVTRAGAQVWRGNLFDAEAIARALAGCDAVVHAAAHLESWGPWAEFEAANVGLTQALLEGARRAGVPAFVHISAALVVMHDRRPAQGLDVSASGEAFFVGDGDPVELRSFLSRRIAAAGLPVPRTSVPTGLARAMAGAVDLAWRTLRLKADPPLVRETVRLIGYPFPVDIDRARRRLGYAPVFAMDEGLRQLAPRAVGGVRTSMPGHAT